MRKCVRKKERKGEREIKREREIGRVKEKERVCLVTKGNRIM